MCDKREEEYGDRYFGSVRSDDLGSVSGGLAGVYYGMEEIPEEWTPLLSKKEWIVELIEKMF